MKIKLVVTKIEPHPKAGERNYQSYGDGVFPDEIGTEILVVELTEEEYAAVKRAVLEVKP